MIDKKKALQIYEKIKDCINKRTIWSLGRYDIKNNLRKIANKEISEHRISAFQPIIKRRNKK